MLRPPRSAGLSSHRSQQQGQVSCRGRASPAAHSAPTAVHAPAATRERPPLFSPVSEAPLTSSSSGTDEELRLGWRTGIENHIAKGRILGSGSFGQVFHGAKLSEGTEVAVKSMPLQRGKLTKEATIRKLQKEVTILERMQECCSVVRLEDLFEDVTNVYVVTELCAGGDLQHFSDVYGPLNERCLALIAFEVALIIKACHDFSIIHGDVKPANFCLKEEHVNPLCSSDATLRRTPWLKAIDFGCSQIHYGTQKLTKRSGTPVFMAPEIFQRSYSFEVDMWSFGVMLYQLYCRRFPFWSDDSYSRALSLDEVARAVTESPIAYDFGPWLQMSPEGLDFIQRCLIRDPEQRMTVVEALTHPWLAKHRCGACSTSSDTSCTQLNNIMPFTARRDAAVAA